jgi:hypothetical protein
MWVQIGKGITKYFQLQHLRYGVYATFNNISVIWWRSVLLVKDTGENNRPVARH